MPVVGFSDLQQHATDQRYGLAVVNVHALPIANAIIATATRLDAPVVLSVCGDRLGDGILPSVEVIARAAPIPVGLLGKRIQTADQAVQAIRLGCNALALAEGLGETVAVEIRDIAGSCGIPVIGPGGLSGALFEIDEALESATLRVLGHEPTSWHKLDQLVAQAAAEHMQSVFDELGASGQGQGALGVAEPWRPVEHLIIYNTTTDDAASAGLAAEGRRVLDRIPGVRATWSGRSVKDDAGYRWCWLIRFAHPAVIDSYREHPDHVAYADNHFRPVAGNRVSIDYVLIGADENPNSD